MTTSADQTARVWRTTDFSEVQVLQHEAKRWVWDAAFSADSQYIFTGKHVILVLTNFAQHNFYRNFQFSIFKESRSN